MVRIAAVATLNCRNHNGREAQGHAIAKQQEVLASYGQELWQRPLEIGGHRHSAIVLADHLADAYKNRGAIKLLLKEIYMV